MAAGGRTTVPLHFEPWGTLFVVFRKPAKSEVAIEVTNAWVNRLIGDQQPDATTKYTDVKPYKANAPLLPSGLLGPVQVYSVAAQP
ncbi:MAG: hypothetical protein ACRD3H_17285 [Terriglobales bacterium]|jgi:hypothetical protein